MKHCLFFLASATTLLAACSSNDAPTTNPQDVKGPEIELSVSSPQASVTSRGTGTVGGIVTQDGSIITANKWAGQTINVFMTGKGSLDLTQELDDNGLPTGTYIYPFTSMNTPQDATTGTVERTDKQVKYYPPTGAFDFWGYHADDAIAKGTVPSTSADGTLLTLPFKINGTQDIMTAKAVLSEEQKTVMAADKDKEEYYYSAFAARRGVQPELTFRHELTRLTFSLTANSAEEADDTAGVYVTGIKVYSKTTGRLIVAYKPETKLSPDSTLAIFDADSAALSLKARAANANANTSLIDITEANAVHPAWNAQTGTSTPVAIGEALLVAPADAYSIVVYMRQRKMVVQADGTKEAIYENKRFPLPTRIKPTNGAFLKGHSYNVNIKIYGLQKVQISTTLTPWIQGEDINVDEDK